MINPYKLERIILDMNIPKYTGIYFMFDKEDNLIYIGKSKNVLRRIIYHINHGRFWVEFIDKISCINYDKEDLQIEEQRYISKYLPKYNYESGSHEYDDLIIQGMNTDYERKMRGY